MRIWPCLSALALLAGCSVPPPPFPTPQQIPAPSPAQVESVVFLVGDAGQATRDRYPILPRLKQEVEWWAERLEADSAITVLFLGDIVYPLGLHEPGTPEFPGDSAVVADQLDLVTGPWALRRSARAYFLAGNHDWGLRGEWEGYVRLKTLDDFLDRARVRSGADVRLAPEAGSGGPYVTDVGEHLRMLLLDTAWWLLAGGRISHPDRPQVLAGIEEAIRTAGSREIVIAAHHPFRTAGSHGGEFSFWRTLGVRYILVRSGAVLQDLTSIPYRELETGLRGIFARHAPPLLFAGGHDHSLQVFAAVEPTDPSFSVVSGSASKLSGVGPAEGLLFGAETPGYMRMIVERGGGITLYVEGSPAEFQRCGGEGPELAECMAAGVASFRTLHSQRLR
jgi:hypothetical protein